MNVILIEDVFELGHRGDVVKVASGYGRNFLIPRKLAIMATPGNLRVVEQQRLALAKREAKDRAAAEILAADLGQVHVLISRRCGETGVLFGSVTAKDIADVLADNGVNLDRRKIILHQPIKKIGNFPVEVRPHSDVEATILVSVLPEGEVETARTMRRGEESDKVIGEVNSKVAELEVSISTLPQEPQE